MVAAVATLLLGCVVAMALECPVKVLMEKSYHLLDDDAGEQIGSYSVAFDSYEDEVIMVDEFEVIHRDRLVGYNASVTLGPDGDGVMRPREASISTTVEGEPCMTGTIRLDETTWRYSGEGVRDAGSGEELDPPATFEKEDIPRPEMLIVFPQTLIYFGPVWLPENGERVIAFAEFPVDIGPASLIDIREDFRLIRLPFGDEGGFVIELTKPNHKPKCRAEYDADGNCTSLNLFPNWGMAEHVAADDEPTADAPDDVSDEPGAPEPVEDDPEKTDE